MSTSDNTPVLSPSTQCTCTDPKPYISGHWVKPCYLCGKCGKNLTARVENGSVQVDSTEAAQYQNKVLKMQLDNSQATVGELMRQRDNMAHWLGETRHMLNDTRTRTEGEQWLLDHINQALSHLNKA